MKFKNVYFDNLLLYMIGEETKEKSKGKKQTDTG